MQIKKDKKTVVIIGIALFLCVIVVGIFVIVANSTDRKLARQLELGQKYLEELDYEQAIIAFTKAIEIDPNCLNAYLGMADVYADMENMEVAVAILEEGYKLTANEMIRQRLDELYSNMAKAENVEKEESIVKENVAEEQGELADEEDSYYELGFSPEDFTLAGYSVMDGDHREDIYQVMKENLPAFEDVWGEDSSYTGFVLEGSDPIVLEYFEEGEEAKGCFPIVYDATSLCVSYYSELDNSGFPFYEGKIVPGITKDILDVLEIREVVEQTKENGKTKNSVEEEYMFWNFEDEEDCLFWEFESQYGTTGCWCKFDGNDTVEFCRLMTESWQIKIRLDWWDSTVWWMEIRKL